MKPLKNHFWTTLLLLCFSLMMGFTQTSQIDLIQPISVFIECANDGNGEVVSGEIGIHGVLHFDANGNLLKSHFHPQGGSIYGETTGTRFQTTGVSTGTLIETPGASNFSFVNRIHFVGEGGIRFIVFETIHFTVNAIGDFTVDFFNEVFDCKS